MLVILEFLNTYLRGLSIINMKIGITLRKGIFIFLAFLLVYYYAPLKGRRIRIGKRNIAYILLYIFFIVIYFFNNSINITDLSNLIMPFIIGGLAITCNYNSNSTFHRFILTFFILISSWMYFSYVVNGTYHSQTGGINLIYFIVSLLPIILKDSNKVYRYLLAGIIITISVASLKTTAVASIAVVLLIDYIFRSKNKSLRIVFLPFILLVVIASGVYLSKKFLGIDIYKMFIQTNISDGGNGRTIIWKNVSEEYMRGTSFQILFGRGYDAVAIWSGLSAHNDFLEIFFDYGAIGGMLFIFCLFKLISLIPVMIIRNYEHTTLYIELIGETLVFFMFSNAIFQASYILLIILYIFTIKTEFMQRKCP